MRYCELFEDYKTVTKKFLDAGADPAEVKKSIATFRSLQNRFSGDEKNIDYWGTQGWKSFEKFILDKSQEKSKREILSATGDSLVLRDDGQWRIEVPLNHESSCHIAGKTTDWCVAKSGQNYFSDYFFQDKITLIFMTNKISKQKWAISYIDPQGKTFEITSPKNTVMTNTEFSELPLL